MYFVCVCVCVRVCLYIWVAQHSTWRQAILERFRLPSLNPVPLSLVQLSYISIYSIVMSSFKFHNLCSLHLCIYYCSICLFLTLSFGKWNQVVNAALIYHHLSRWTCKQTVDFYTSFICDHLLWSLDVYKKKNSTCFVTVTDSNYCITFQWLL